MRHLFLTLLVTAAIGCTTTSPPRKSMAPDPGPISELASEKQKDLRAMKLFRGAQEAMGRGEAKEALKLYREAQKLYESLGDFSAQAAIHNDLGLILRSADQPEKALELLQRAVELGKQGDEPAILSEAQLNLGLLHYDQGRNEAAEMFLSDAIASADKATAIEVMGLAHNARGNTRRRMKELPGAIEDYRAAVAKWSTLERNDFAAVSAMNLGYCNILGDDYDAAASAFQTAIDLLDAPSPDRDVLLPHLDGMLRLVKTDPKAAREKVLKALAP